MRAVLSALAFAVVSTAACKSEAPPAAAPTSQPSSAPSAPTPPPTPPRTGTRLDDVMDSYEALRVRLAGDDFPGARIAAEKLATTSAAALEPGAPMEAHLETHVKTIEVGAQKVQQAPDMTAARMAFGDISRATVALLVAKPELQTGRFLMMCPMAKGYQKWVQTDQALRNPYYGSEMLECGEQLKAWSA